SFFRQNEACPCKGKPHFLLPQLPPPHPHNALTFVIELFDIYSDDTVGRMRNEKFATLGKRSQSHDDWIYDKASILYKSAMKFLFAPLFFMIFQSKNITSGQALITNPSDSSPVKIPHYSWSF
ncbi:MAG: hypothetical protein ACOY3I_04110, partial [Verrucomicrobiota bacterium]